MPVLAPTATPAPRATSANDVGGDSDDADFSFDVDPSSYEARHSHPLQSDASPTVKAKKSETTSGAEDPRDKSWSGGDGDTDGSHTGEEMTTNYTTALATSPSSSQHAVNPATIPMRTSSSRVVSNSSNVNSPKKRSSKHASLSSVPEDWRYSYRGETDDRNGTAHGRRGSHHDQANSHASTFTSSRSQTPDPLRLIQADLVNGDSPAWSPEKEKILKGPFDYLESHPGKDIRTQMITAFNAWLRVPTSSLGVITRVVGMLHTASLLVDDVEDSSSLRRGVPVAHSIFGTAQTINSANYVYFCALQELLKLHNPAVIQIYTEELLNLHRGQGMDLFWRDTLTCPSEDDYLEMVGKKTGGLFRLAIKLMCAESPSYQNSQPFHVADSAASTTLPVPPQTDYIPLVNTIGLLFQILDDYRNLASPLYTANKGLCEDLTEGKFSFPIIHAIRSDPSNLVLINILKQKTTDEDVKRYAVAYMESATGSFVYTRRVLRGLTKRALALVDGVDAGRGRGEGVRAILEGLRVDGAERGSHHGASPAAAAAAAAGATTEVGKGINGNVEKAREPLLPT